ncbi:MAG: 2Fe-2S iron-sulfur cluster-binding protein [Victivallis sp.]
MRRKKKTLFVNNREIEIAGERNLLELIRKAGIDIPTFCYHSELSIYGACRLCLVDVEGKRHHGRLLDRAGSRHGDLHGHQGDPQHAQNQRRAASGQP